MREVFKDATNQTQYVVLRSATTGLAATSKLYTDITASYTRSRAARAAISMNSLASPAAAWTAGGFVEVDAASCPGLYRFDVPDAAFATGVDRVVLSLKATGVLDEHLEVILVDWNKQLASIPNVVAAAAGGLPTVDVNNAVKVQSGTGANQISLNSGEVTVGTNNDKDDYELAADAVDATQFTQAAANKVWVASVRELTSFGTLVVDLAAAVWTYVDRTLTQLIAAVTPPPVIVGSTIRLLRGDTVVLSFTNVGSLLGRDKLWFTLKNSDHDTDLNALVQIEETAGLIRLNGAVATASQGSLVVSDETVGDFTVTLTPPASALLIPFGGLVYDIQKLTGIDVETVTSGAANVVADVTRATS